MDNLLIKQHSMAGSINRRVISAVSSICSLLLLTSLIYGCATMQASNCINGSLMDTDMQMCASQSLMDKYLPKRTVFEATILNAQRENLIRLKSKYNIAIKDDVKINSKWNQVVKNVADKESSNRQQIFDYGQLDDKMAELKEENPEVYKYMMTNFIPIIKKYIREGSPFTYTEKDGDIVLEK